MRWLKRCLICAVAIQKYTRHKLKQLGKRRRKKEKQLSQINLQIIKKSTMTRDNWRKRIKTKPFWSLYIYGLFFSDWTALTDLKRISVLLVNMASEISHVTIFRQIMHFHPIVTSCPSYPYYVTLDLRVGWLTFLSRSTSLVRFSSLDLIAVSSYKVKSNVLKVFEHHRN